MASDSGVECSMSSCRVAFFVSFVCTEPGLMGISISNLIIGEFNSSFAEFTEEG